MNRMLSSWKEIAQFFGKGVRTVQRWEKTLDLPIRRPPGAPSNVVLARTSDLEEWMHRGPGRRAEADLEVKSSDELTKSSVDEAVDELEEATLTLIARLGQTSVSVQAQEPVAVDATARIRMVASHLRDATQESDRRDGQQLRRVA